MKFTLVTLFPEVFESVFSSSILARAQQKGTIEINYLNLREFGIGPHHTVDDKPYGGGTGMVIRVDIVDKALQTIPKNENTKVILLEPIGRKYTQQAAEEFSVLDHLVIICGHYEGFDARVRDLVDETISLGDFVLSGGEIPAMAIVESTARLVNGVLSKKTATEIESFSQNDEGRILEFPQYTRPEEYKGMKIPSVLLSGDHAKIKEYRNKEALKLTQKTRPDLLK